MTTPWDTMKRFCSDATTVVLAAPYLKADMMEMFLNTIPGEANLICITRWKLLDIQQGASDIACWNLVSARNGVFRMHPRLHAKYYRFDDRVLVGSANLTMSGMGLIASANLEILTKPDAMFDAASLERQLLHESRIVSADEFQAWQSVVSIASSRSTLADADVFDDWRPRTRDPEHVWLVYNQRLDRVPSDDEQRLAKIDLEHLGLPPDLNRPDYTAWVRVRLSASVMVNDVRLVMDMDDDAAVRAHLVAAWSVRPGEAERIRSTLASWVHAFFES